MRAGTLGAALALALLVSGAAAVRPLAQQAAVAAHQRHHRHHDQDDKDLNLRPLIGIISQLGDPASKHHSYIAASYVKFVESAGARAVPILCDMPPEEVERRFRAINGVLIPGGSQDLRKGQPFFDTVARLFDLAVEANDKGDYFPIHGTCLGMETLSILAARNETVLSDFDAENLPTPIFLTDAALSGKSRFFNALPKQVVKNLQRYPYAMENHAHGLAWTAVDQNPPLKDFFEVLSLSVDRQGAVYVSTVEAKDYPITATQWHPEKNAFEWSPDKDIPHHPDAIEITQEVANFFVSEARRNHHWPRDQEEEEALLIYNWAPTYTGKHRYKGEEVDFVESYIFPAYGEFAAQLKERRQAGLAAEAEQE